MRVEHYEVQGLCTVAAVTAKSAIQMEQTATAVAAVASAVNASAPLCFIDSAALKTRTSTWLQLQHESSLLLEHNAAE